MIPVKKIVVIGPESTGKSTLSAGLAAHLQTVWVEEYARAYLEQQGNTYQYSDLLAIARGQLALEEQCTATANRFLICDTDLHVLMVWCHHRYGKVHAYILEEIARRKYDAYILCKTDIPWTPDPQREYPDYNERFYFYNIYKDIVINSGCPFIVVEGNVQQRLRQALNSGLFRLPETQNK